LTPTTPKMTTTPTCQQNCDDIVTIKEQVRQLQIWQAATNADIRRLLDMAAKIDLLMNLSIGGGALSLISLLIFLTKIALTGQP